MNRATENSSEDDASDRTCIATRQVRPPEEMIRFVRAPDGQVVPDLRRRLPGRGVWVTAQRQVVQEAMKRKAFGRSFKAEVQVDPDLPETIDRLLAEATLQSLAMANKAGRAVSGFSKVEAALRSGQAAVLLHASDAAPDGRRKLAQVARGRVKAVDLFGAEQLSLALGRPHVIHAALFPGPVSAAFIDRSNALARYRGLTVTGMAAMDVGDGEDLRTAEAEGLDAE